MRRRQALAPLRGRVLGGLILEDRRQASRLAWRAPLWAALALVLYQIQRGVMVHLPWMSLDLSSIFLAFFVLRLGLIEGALAAFCVGYLAVLFHAPPGLAPFLAVLLWTASHLLLPRYLISNWLGASLFVFALSLLFQAGMIGGEALASGYAPAPGQLGLQLLAQAARSALVTAPLHAGLLRIERATAGYRRETRQR